MHEESRLRPTLLPGLLRALALNASHRYPDVALFEIGNVFGPAPDGGVPRETERLAVAVSGADALAASRLWRLLTDALRVVEFDLKEAPMRGMHPTRAAAVHVGLSSAGIGTLGEVDPAVREAFGVKERVAWIEVDLVPFLAARETAPAYQPISRFPSSDIDLAFVFEHAKAARRRTQQLNERRG